MRAALASVVAVVLFTAVLGFGLTIVCGAKLFGLY